MTFHGSLRSCGFVQPSLSSLCLFYWIVSCHSFLKSYNQILLKYFFGILSIRLNIWNVARCTQNVASPLAEIFSMLTSIPISIIGSDLIFKRVNLTLQVRLRTPIWNSSFFYNLWLKYRLKDGSKCMLLYL